MQAEFISSKYNNFRFPIKSRSMAYEHLRDLLVEKGKTQIDLAAIIGRTPAVVTNLFNGERKLQVEEVEKISHYFNVPIEFVLYGQNVTRLVPVLGYVGAGAEVFAIDDHAKGASLEEVTSPVGFTPDGIIALRVRGDSMEPQMEDGWLIFYHRMTDGVPHECIGELCVVQLENDGLLVKKVKHGSMPGRYHLMSKNPNSDPIIDTKLVWASRVIDIRPK